MKKTVTACVQNAGTMNNRNFRRHVGRPQNSQIHQIKYLFFQNMTQELGLIFLNRLLLQLVPTLFYNLKKLTMIKVKRMKQNYAFTVDLVKIQGEGDFQCPKCGCTISPDDTTEETYSIIEPKVNNYGLEELVISCNNCSSQIHLTGFSLLEKLSIQKLKTKNCNDEVFYFLIDIEKLQFCFRKRILLLHT